jgi:5-(carboxyamino)imidazole ribonucleotide mutase
MAKIPSKKIALNASKSKLRDKKISLKISANSAKNSSEPKIVIAMGSPSDYATMSNCEEILRHFAVEFETKIISAHRTPQRLFEFASSAKSKGLQVIIAGAGGAAHLPGMIASLTELPVLGVPVESKSLKGLDSMLSIVQMPAGVPVGTLAIGEAGAKNAALLAISILALSDKNLAEKLAKYRQKQSDSVALRP